MGLFGQKNQRLLKAWGCFCDTLELHQFTHYQRRSRGHKARGQGQGHKKSPRPRPRTAFPRTKPLEAKDRNARGQGPRTEAQAFSPPKKRSSKIFSGDLQFIGVPRIFDWGRPKHKSHEMTSSKFFQRVSFCGTKIS